MSAHSHEQCYKGTHVGLVMMHSQSVLKAYYVEVRGMNDLVTSRGHLRYHEIMPRVHLPYLHVLKILKGLLRVSCQVRNFK
jgi:hypothetical protein